MAEIPPSVIILGGFLIWTIIVAPASVWTNRYLHKYFWDIKKIWSIELNGNTMLGKVSLVKSTADGFKAQNGLRVDTDSNFAFKDTGKLTAGCPIFVWDRDTAQFLRPFSGETEQSDPAVNEAKNLGDAIREVKASGQQFPWGMAIIALFLLIIVGFSIMAFMLQGRGG